MSRVQQVLFGRPGLKFFAQLTPAKIRCLWGSGGRLFAIHGGNETEIHQNGSQTTQPGTVAQGTGSPDPAQIFSNGNQLMIVSGGLVYCDNGAGPVQVLMAMTGTASATGTNNEVTWLTGPLFTAAMTGKTLRFDGNIYTITGVISTGPSAFQVMLVSPNPPATPEGTWEVAAGDPLDGVSGGFLDGYFIVNRVPNPGGSPDLGTQFNISALYDGTSWNPLDFGIKEGYADYINSVLCDHEELWLFGKETTEVWTDVGVTLDASGVASFPFQRVQGAFIHDGSVATYAPCSVGSYTCWLGGSPTGQTGRISSPGVSARTNQHLRAGTRLERARFHRARCDFLCLPRRGSSVLGNQFLGSTANLGLRHDGRALAPTVQL